MKITDIKESRMTTRERVNEFGQRVRTQEPILIKRKVRTIQGGARFFHYFLDVVFLTLFSSILFFIGVLEPTSGGIWFDTGGGHFELNLAGFIITFLYYLITEMTIGTTLGKLVLKRYVINEYAQKPEFGDVLVRTLARLVPFEAFSCLGERGWHDRWSHTYVVSKQEWDFLKKSIGEEEGGSQEILDDL